ncbi:MAG: formyl transferase [Planctomyces sp.]|nr:formyl transferase [Planctomyces sp.]
MRTVLICQSDAPLAREGMARWLASCSELAGLIVLDETGGRRWQRIRREARRIGWLRMLDVFAFRVYQRLALAGADAAFCRRQLQDLCERYPPLPADLSVHSDTSPNSAAAVRFLEERQPDVVIASCKHLLKPKVFQIPRTGCFALHPGICPEYRNAHGCFWALAHDDVSKVGTTLLKIDAGVDTGPIYGYFGGAFDEVSETHLMIQRRMTLGNLDAIGRRLREAHQGQARPIDVSGRKSAEWGQPWLTAYLRWKRQARQRARDQRVASPEQAAASQPTR